MYLKTVPQSEEYPHVCAVECACHRMCVPQGV